jgi:hypothetical protein
MAAGAVAGGVATDLDDGVGFVVLAQAAMASAPRPETTDRRRRRVVSIGSGQASAENTTAASQPGDGHAGQGPGYNAVRLATVWMTDISARAPDRLSRLYAWTVDAADAVHRHRFTAVVVGAPLVTVLIAAINRWVLLGFPNSGDEYNYLYEAQTFAAGRLWNPPQNPPEIFATNYVVQEPDRTFSSFPFGWPVLLALALRVGLPAWLVNPLLGTVTLGLVWGLGARLYNPRVGVLAAALVGVSPFFLFNAASYFSHTLCGALLVGAACSASRGDRRPAWVPMMVGFLIGWAVVCRYLTGVVCGVPIVLWLLRSGAPRIRTLLLVALGGLPWVAALAWYNWAMTGHPLTLTTTALTVSLWFRDGWLLRSADILSTHLLRHLLWTPPVLILAYVLYLRVAPRETRRGPLDWMLAITVAVLYFYVERGGNQYGPRFHYEVFLFGAVFVVANVFRFPALDQAPVRDQWVFGLLAASVLVLPVSLAVHAGVERRVIVERMDPFTQAERSHLRDALVLIYDRVGSARSIGAADLTRNGIDHRGPVLWGLYPPDDRPCDWTRQVPGRRPYLYVWDQADAAGVLSPLQCGPPSASAAPAAARAWSP